MISSVRNENQAICHVEENSDGASEVVTQLLGIAQWELKLCEEGYG